MRVLVCGDRNECRKAYIYDQIRTLPRDTVIIEGGARGVDTIARQVAESLGLKIEEYRANWRKHGKAAGPIRNFEMLTEGKPDEVWAFHADIEASKGTKHMVKIAKQAGVPVKIFQS